MRGRVENAKKVLVIGDWVVDEHWVVSDHRSKTRSRTPEEAHYRSLQSATSSMRTLAGAGKTSSVLWSASASNAEEDPASDVTIHACERLFEVGFLGAWGERDEPLLLELMDAENAECLTHFFLAPPVSRRKQSTARSRKERDQKRAPAESFRLRSPETEPNSQLVSVGQEDSDPMATDRVMRIYRQAEPEPELRVRLDWELERKMGKNPYKLPDSAKRKKLLAFLKNLDAVVVKDMAKGVVNAELLSALIEQIGIANKGRKNPLWFISSKLWEPDWRDALTPVKQDVRLFIVPQVAAATAVEKGVVGRWISHKDSPSFEAMEEIERIQSLFPKAVIVVLPKGLSLIARASTDGESYLMTQPIEGKGLSATGVPMASVFLPTMVALLLKQEGSGGATTHFSGCDTMKSGFSAALAFTEAWGRTETERLTTPRVWRPKISQVLFVDNKGIDIRRLKQSSEREFESIKWTTCMEGWRSALEGRGVIVRPEDRKPTIDLRRAMSEVDGYVSLLPKKKEVLRRLRFLISAQNQMNRAYMLKASPGVGKSFLIESLTTASGRILLRFNITSLLRQEDLLDCFDTIVTSQARNRGKQFLVFFDEIDAELEGNPVYSAFLRPLEEGLYLRGGRDFQFEPCVWVFAGTHDPSEVTSQNDPRVTKGSDFVSRLSNPPIPFGDDPNHPEPPDLETESLARLENVYAGVAMLKRVFPDVDQVSEAVLEAFRTLPPRTPARRIYRLVQRFQEVNYGKVTLRNLPHHWAEEKDLGIPKADQERWDQDGTDGQRREAEDARELDGRPLVKIVSSDPVPKI